MKFNNLFEEENLINAVLREIVLYINLDFLLSTEICLKPGVYIHTETLISVPSSLVIPTLSLPQVLILETSVSCPVCVQVYI